MLHRLRLAIYLPLLYLLRMTSQREAIERDAIRACMPAAPTDSLPSPESHSWLVLEGLSHPQVRSVVYTRLHFGRPWEKVAAKILRRLLPGLREFELNCADIGPGFVIGHGYGSVIWAEHIGRDCIIHQGVTLGYKDDALPTLGDGVWIYSGAVVLGGVSIGDRSVIAAQAVVLSNVPSDCTVGGVPARRLDVSGSDSSLASL